MDSTFSRFFAFLQHVKKVDEANEISLRALIQFWYVPQFIRGTTMKSCDSLLETTSHAHTSTTYAVRIRTIKGETKRKKGRQADCYNGAPGRPCPVIKDGG